MNSGKQVREIRKKPRAGGGARLYNKEMAVLSKTKRSVPTQIP